MKGPNFIGATLKVQINLLAVFLVIKKACEANLLTYNSDLSIIEKCSLIDDYPFPAPTAMLIYFTLVSLSIVYAEGRSIVPVQHLNSRDPKSSMDEALISQDFRHSQLFKRSLHEAPPCWKAQDLVSSAKWPLSIDLTSW
jgi:hypothetical protein